MSRSRPDPGTALGRAVAAALGGLPDPARPAKYRNIKAVRDGLRFDSQGEARRWDELQLYARTGRIKNLRRQVRVDLEVNRRLVAYLVLDFVYEEAGRTVWEDYKSPATMTPAWRVKAKLAEALFNRRIRLSGVDSGHRVGLRSQRTRVQKKPPLPCQGTAATRGTSG